MFDMTLTAFQEHYTYNTELIDLRKIICLRKT